jgi:hypothetical protein
MAVLSAFCLTAHAQLKVPARQISVNTNNLGTIPKASLTNLQTTVDYIVTNLIVEAADTNVIATKTHVANNYVTPAQATNITRSAYMPLSIVSIDPNPMVVFNMYAVDCSAGPVNMTLPSSPTAGDRVIIIDHTASADSNTITVKQGGEKIMGLAEDMTITVANSHVGLVYVNSTYGWRIYQ